jgi:hypothetical protein
MIKNSLLAVIILVLTLISTSLVAENRRVGHMKPYASETLAQPMRLGCGVTVFEWRGGGIDRAKVESLCLLATSNFDDFLAKVGIRKLHDKRFDWSLSLSPWGNCYRCINDLEWRFRYRAARFWVTGYTSFNFRYTFMMGNTGHPNFNVTVAHELFHAMSYYYGVFEQHRGNRAQKIIADEKLAVGFTKWLGLGR